MKTAIITLTKGGVELGLHLQERLAGSELYVPERHKDMVVVSQPSLPITRHLSLVPMEKDKAQVFDGFLKELIARIFAGYDGFIFIMATGIVVRVIAPFIKGKDVDPAVVVMDEAGRFVISLLSGHLGGANELAREVAGCIGATPVITTATDVCGKLCAEDLARELEGEIENVRMIKNVNAAFLHDEPVAINIPSEKRDTLKSSGNFVFYDSLEDLLGSGYTTLVAVTNRLKHGIEEGCLVIRPRNLVVGVGCNRNTSADEIEEAVFKVLRDNGLSQKSIRNLASIDAKGDEAGLLGFAKKHDLTIDFFTKEELEKVDFVTAPSRHVMEAVGVGGVCEPAAMLSAKGSMLLVPKVKSGNVTVAVAEAAPSFDKSI